MQPRKGVAVRKRSARLVKRHRRPRISNESLRSGRDYLLAILDPHWYRVAPVVQKLREGKIAVWQIAPYFAFLSNVPHDLLVLKALSTPFDRDTYERVAGLMGSLRLGSEFTHLRKLRLQKEKTAKQAAVLAVRRRKCEELLKTLDLPYAASMSDEERVRYTSDLRTKIQQFTDEESLEHQVVHRLQRDYDIRLAYLAQVELMKICTGQRCSLDSRKLANALAGFPNIGWRRSAQRCNEFRASGEVGGLGYRVVITLRRLVKTVSWGAPDFVEHAIAWMKHARPSRWNGVLELKRNAKLLKLALLAVQSLNPDPGDIPYQIAREYFQRKLEGKSDLSPLDSLRESLHDALI